VLALPVANFVIFSTSFSSVQRDELTPGIPRTDYEERRKKLMDLLPEKSAVVSVAAPMKYMSGNIFYKYRQNSNFWYLTGFEEPNSAVILRKDSSSRGYTMTLFCHGKDLHKEKWDGASTSLDAAKELFAADDALSISSFGTYLKSLVQHVSHVYVDLPGSSTEPSKRTSLLKFLIGPSTSENNPLFESISNSLRRPLAPHLGMLRVVKSKAEQKVMLAAATISGRAHAKSMRFTQPGLSEASVAAHFEYICALGGAQRPAYVPVVASGPNALILHYTANNQIINLDELVLMDAGCEYNGYASDITRTYPASGTFSDPQRELYSAVLSAQKDLIALCTASAGYSLQELHRESCVLLKKELNSIGFNIHKGDLERILYPHYLGHPVGIDLHETSFIDRAAPLQEGMIITIEPGVYVPPNANFPKQFHDIGIRIEDEVLIGEEDPVVLSTSAPKEVEDIEGACQGALGLEPH